MTLPAPYDAGVPTLTGVAATVVNCPTCGRRFSSARELAKHMKTLSDAGAICTPPSHEGNWQSR